MVEIDNSSYCSCAGRERDSTDLMLHDNQETNQVSVFFTQVRVS